MKVIPTLDIVSCLGGSMQTCGLEADDLHKIIPQQIMNNAGLELQWRTLKPMTNGSTDSKILHLNEMIRNYTQYYAAVRQPFLIIGGDHSCAMGTWTGVLNAMDDPKHFGLIWLDAHLDAHTFSTSRTQNLHGMPVAALIGRADKRLAGLYPSARFVPAEKLIIVGARSYEPEELQLLVQANVQIVFSRQFNTHHDFAYFLLAAVRQLSLSCHSIGISLDMDCIDPEDAPGVETPVPHGIKARHLLAALQLINRHPLVCGLEICEYSPGNDRQHKTVQLIRQIITTFYGDSSANKSLGLSRDGINEISVPN